VLASYNGLANPEPIRLQNSSMSFSKALNENDLELFCHAHNRRLRERRKALRTGINSMSFSKALNENDLELNWHVHNRSRRKPLKREALELAREVCASLVSFGNGLT